MNTRKPFKVWDTFVYLHNRHCVLWVGLYWVYVIDIDYDPEFTNPEVYFLEYRDIFDYITPNNK